MTSTNSIRDTFFEECEELLEALSEGLSLMDSGDHDAETVNAVFRAVHSVKGGAGAFQLAALVGFAHRFETLLDLLRADRLELTPEVMHTLLRAADHLADHVEAAHDERQVDPALTQGFVDQLDACMGEQAAAVLAEQLAADASFSFAAVTLDFGNLGLPEPDPAFLPPNAASIDPAPLAELPPVAPALDLTRIDFQPHPALYANGHDPGLIIAALAELGPLTATPDLSAMPDWPPMSHEAAWLGWHLQLQGPANLAQIESCFEFVDELCGLRISPTEPTAPDPLPKPATQLAAPPDPAALALAPLPESVAEPMAGQPPPPAPAALSAASPAPGAARASALPPRRDARAADDESEGRVPKPTLRVDLERVDRLINAVGELIINQAMIEQSILDLSLPSDAEVITHVEDYRLLARDLQEAVMAIRAQPVKPLFQRMSRILREAAEATGKSARLVTIGETTEVDKTVVERLADPLTHMIRNAIDHGLEDSATRLAAGKDPEGTIRLSAAHRSGSVLITIRDDGAGLNRPRILEKAIAKGLVPPDAELSDPEIDNLLFLPGFSTAEKLSNLSGRGVGLDVVKNAVNALGGRIAITSHPGEGTEFAVSLPLTLAVMDGMVISVAGQTMVIPIASVVETIRPLPGDLHLLGTHENLLSMRGRFLPMIDVAQCLGFPERDPARVPLLLLVETEHQSQCALIVDAVLDQRQVVIKGLDSNYGAVPGVSAATVLGDGQIALILDAEALTTSRHNLGLAPPRPPAPPSTASNGASHAVPGHAIH